MNNLKSWEGNVQPKVPTKKTICQAALVPQVIQHIPEFSKTDLFDNINKISAKSAGKLYASVYMH